MEGGVWITTRDSRRAKARKDPHCPLHFPPCHSGAGALALLPRWCKSQGSSAQGPSEADLAPAHAPLEVLVPWAWQHWRAPELWEKGILSELGPLPTGTPGQLLSLGNLLYKWIPTSNCHKKPCILGLQPGDHNDFMFFYKNIDVDILFRINKIRKAYLLCFFVPSCSTCLHACHSSLMSASRD